MTLYHSPFAGTPATTLFDDEQGLIAFDITIRELTPLRTRFADKAGALASAAMTVIAALFLGAQANPSEPLVWGLALGATLLATKPLQLLFRKGAKKTTRLQMKTGEVRLQGKGGKWIVYDRKLAHRFALLDNDRAKLEAERQEFEMRRQRRGFTRMIAKYYGYAPHLILDYVGHRNDVATIFGPARAKIVLERLQSCDAVLDIQLRTGRRATFGPEDERAQGTGTVPVPVAGSL